MARARDHVTIGILPPGPHNAITDVTGVRVGHATVHDGDLRTGVTAVLPHGGNLYRDKVAAAAAVLNGYGKSVGLMQIEELGTIETPILITSTLNVPRAADALISYMLTQDPVIGITETVNPVVLECFDGYLSDARARAVGEDEVRGAIVSASDGPVQTGCVGAGTGMRCLGFKSGVGTASRALPGCGYRLGLLAVPNFGFPGDLIVAGVPVGRELPQAGQPPERGSCVFVLATDAPVDAMDLRRIAWRCFLGMARTGAISGVTSGDLAVAFAATRERVRLDRPILNLLFRAAVESAEEAILDALFGAKTTIGRAAHALPTLPIDETVALLHRTRTRSPSRSRKGE
jgi:D-aminopeptidase